jgi:hypothetical protein
MLVLLDIDISFTLVFEGNPLRYEKGLYLPSIKHDALFHVNMKTFEIFHETKSVPWKWGISIEGMVM